MKLMEKLFGSYSDRELKKLMPIADKIEALEASYRLLSDEQLRAKTDEFKARLAAGETTDDILPEAFATVREAADRVLGLRHYRVQLIGGIVLHQGRIAEMSTGEGKTLVATLPAYLNALTGKGVHIVTVNDYLATPRQRVDGQGLPLSGPDGGARGARRAQRGAAAQPMPPTSPTAPTTNLASTTCATTWSSTRSRWCSAAMPLPSSTRSTPF